MPYDRIALEKHVKTATEAERIQNVKHWVLRLNADGPQEPLRQRPEFVNAFKQCLKMQDAHLAETKHSLIPIRPQHQQRQRQKQQFEASNTMSITRLESGITECHGETRRQHLHLQLQLRSGRLPHGKRVRAHGNVKSTGVCRQDHSQHTSVQYSLFTSLHFIFVRLQRICHLVLHMSHLFVVLSPAVYHEHIIFLIHSPFYHDTRKRSTTGTT